MPAPTRLFSHHSVSKSLTDGHRDSEPRYGCALKRVLTRPDQVGSGTSENVVKIHNQPGGCGVRYKLEDEAHG